MWIKLKSHAPYRTQSRLLVKGKSKVLYSTRDERRIPRLISFLDSQPAGDRNHKTGGRLPRVSARPTFTYSAAEYGRYQIILLGGRGTWVCATCPESIRSHARPEVEPAATINLQIRCSMPCATTPPQLLVPIGYRD